MLGISGLKTGFDQVFFLNDVVLFVDSKYSGVGIARTFRAKKVVRGIPTLSGEFQRCPGNSCPGNSNPPVFRISLLKKLFLCFKNANANAFTESFPILVKNRHPRKRK